MAEGIQADNDSIYLATVINQCLHTMELTEQDLHQENYNYMEVLLELLCDKV